MSSPWCAVPPATRQSGARARSRASGSMPSRSRSTMCPASMRSLQAGRSMRCWLRAPRTRPVGEVRPPGAAALYPIGTANLKLDAKPPAPPETGRRFADALIAEQQQAGLFGASPLKISFLGERLFRTTIAFPANVPTGSYLVEVFLVRDRVVVGGQATALVGSKVGLDAAVSDFATREAAAYGAIAV